MFEYKSLFVKGSHCDHGNPSSNNFQNLVTKMELAFHFVITVLQILISAQLVLVRSQPAPAASGRNDTFKLPTNYSKGEKIVNTRVKNHSKIRSYSG